MLIRDSSAVRRLFVRLAGAVGRQSAFHKQNSRFVAPTLGRHISTFRGYQILYSIRNPYMNRFTNHFLFIHNHLALRKWSYTRAQHNFHIDSIVFPAAFEKGRLNIDKKVTPSALGKYLGHIK